MVRRYKAYSVAVILLLVISLGLNIASAVNQSPDPGSEQDPVVSKSYVDYEIAQLAAKIQMLLEQNDSLKNQNAQLSNRIAAQEKTVKELQEAMKSGTAVNTGAGSSGGTGGTANPPASIGKATVNVDVLNLRKQPNTTSPILGKLLKNETLTLIKKSGDWYQVTTSKGLTGYVKGSLITVIK